MKNNNPFSWAWAGWVVKCRTEAEANLQCDSISQLRLNVLSSLIKKYSHSQDMNDFSNRFMCYSTYMKGYRNIFSFSLS